MAFNFFAFVNGIKIRAKSLLTGDSLGDLEVSDSDNKLHFHNGTSESAVVTEAHAHTLTNKTIDADNNTISNLEVDNLKAGVLDTDLTAVSVSDDTIPSAKATKAYADSVAATAAADLAAHINDAVDAHDASAISVVPAGDLSSTDVQSALVELQTDIDADEAALAAHIANAVDAHDASAISVSPSGDLTSTDVQSALVELQTDIDTSEAGLAAHIADQAAHGATSANTAGKIVARDGSGHIVVSTVKGNVDSASAGGTVNIGATDATTINIGNPGATVNIQGTVHVVDTTNLTVKDPLITLNDGGGAATGGGSGIEIEEAATITGYAKVSADRNGWDLKAPNAAGVATVSPGASNDEVALLAKAQTLTNKTLNADNNTVSNLEVDNLKAGVLDTDLSSVSASDDTIPSAKATKTYVDNEVSTHAADTSTHGVSGAIVGTTDAQTLSDKTFADELTLTGISTPATPAAGQVKIYPKVDGKVYKLTEDGTETEIGAGAGGGAGDLDTILSQTFDSESTAAFTQTGMEIVTDPTIHGDQTARLVHQAGSTRSFKQTISIDRKFRGVNASMSLVIRSSATAGNVTLLVTDETNAVTLLASTQVDTDSSSFSGTTTNASTTVSGISTTDINLLEVGMSVSGTGIASGTTISAVSSSSITLSQAATASGTVTIRYSALPRQKNFSFFIPENCASLSYTISALAETGSPETYIDDVVIRKGLVSYSQTSATVEVPVIGALTAYSPALIGVGTPSTNTISYRQVRDTYEISGDFTTGTVTASEFRLPLPNGAIIAGLPNATGQNIVGYGERIINPSAANALIVFLGRNGDNYVCASLGNTNGTNTGSTQPGSSLFNSGERVSINNISVPVSGLSATQNNSLAFSSPVSVGQALLNSTEIEVPVKTEPQAVSVTIGAVTTAPTKGTVAIDKGSWHQDGNEMVFSYQYRQTAAGSAGSGVYLITIPNGCSIDTTVLTPSADISAPVVGFGVVQTTLTDNGNDGEGLTVVAYSSTQLALVTQDNDGTLTRNNRRFVGSTSYPLSSSTIAFSFSCRIPIEQFSAVETKSIPLTNAVLVEEPNSTIRLNGVTANGSTAIYTPRYNTILQSEGDALQYQDSATNGSSITVLKDGVYTFTASHEINAVNMHVALTKNQSSLTVSATANPIAEILALSREGTNNHGQTVSWTGELNAGDIIRVSLSATSLPGNATYCMLTGAYQGKLKQVNVSSDHKVEIPSSEVRLEGASAKGATATGIVKFDTLAKIRGDGFTVTSTSADGTYLTVTKPGFLSINVSLYKTTSNQLIQITKNQTTLTSYSTVASELLSSAQANNTAGESMVVSCANVSVVAGDVIRVAAVNAPQSDASNVLIATLQEQKVQVALSNVLPQFTDSDGALRLDGAAGYGSTATMIRRFSNLRVNTISDCLQYTDSATAGASFTVLKAGTYTFSYSDDFNAISTLGLSLNSANLTTAVQAIPGSERLAYDTAGATNHGCSISWTGYLNVGDVVRPHAAGAAVGLNNATTFTASRIGKPNITSVDVTPFVNAKLEDREYIRMGSSTTLARGSTATGVYYFPTIEEHTSKGLISIATDSVDGTRFTCLKECFLTLTLGNFYGSGGAYNVYFTKNSSTTLVTTPSAASMIGGGTFASSQRTSHAVSVRLVPGDVLRVQTEHTGTIGSDSLGKLSIVATAMSNNAVAQNSTFKISDYLTSGSRVTSTPTALGQYRSQVRTAGSYAYSDTNGAPTAAPTAADGIKIYMGSTFATGDSSGQPSRYEIFIGKNKNYRVEWYQAAGRTGYINTTPFNSYQGGAAAASSFICYGYEERYDPTTGILRITPPLVGSFDTTKAGHNGAGTNYAEAYFDVVVSDNPMVSASTPRSEITVDTGNGHGSTNNRIRRFTNLRKSVGSDITYADSATAGSSFTINTPGVYAISYQDCGSVQVEFGITVNSTQLTTGISTITYSGGKRADVITSTAAFPVCASWTGFLSAGDVVRPHTDSAPNNTSDRVMFTIVKVSN